MPGIHAVLLCVQSLVNWSLQHSLEVGVFSLSPGTVEEESFPRLLA